MKIKDLVEETNCIIILEDIKLNIDTAEKANEENIPILSAELNSYKNFL